MAKLYFRYGAVGSAKTLNLLAVSHNYQQQSKHVVIMKPQIDTRFGAEAVKSRAGLEQQADYVLTQNKPINIELLLSTGKPHCILVDEAQFLSTMHVNQLRVLATDWDIPVICYGLRTDFYSRLFEGSKRLLELADSIEEIKTTCAYCNRKAIFNLKLNDGKPTLLGPQIELGAEEKYLPTCATCYSSQLKTQKQPVFANLAEL